MRSSLSELHEWLPWAHMDYTREDAIAFVRDSIQAWREGKAFDYAIRRRDDPETHVGNISIWQTSRSGRIGEIGYWIRTDMSGRGYATEATRALMAVGYDHLGLHKLTLRIAVGNRGSERVAEKLGFTCEGVLRRAADPRQLGDHTSIRCWKASSAAPATPSQRQRRRLISLWSGWAAPI